MKMYIVKCHFKGGRVIKFRAQACDLTELGEIANAMITWLTHRAPEKVELCHCPNQGAAQA